MTLRNDSCDCMKCALRVTELKSLQDIPHTTTTSESNVKNSPITKRKSRAGLPQTASFINLANQWKW
ncbi:hypothetical protein CDAR_204071 [Caerostris darwini]|uniref:Uncharacterized protein n=1 Tax=Caerostris darwini TaxID=1538125 RepID=A0AAV4RQX6_9ARAC|nr:hypothetical protein CDAR_204071 [Caerostris darwini]